MNQEFSVTQFIRDLQKDLMYHIILNVRKRNLDRERAQKVAKDFLDTKNNAETVEDLLRSLCVFISVHPEIHAVFLKNAPLYYTYSRNSKLSVMSQLLLTKEFEKAVQCAQQKTYLKQITNSKGGEN